MIDPFSEAVALLQPRLPFSKQASGAGSWRIHVSVTDDPLFCVVLEGAALLSVNGLLPIELGENDFILVPSTSTFVMSSVDGGPPEGRSVVSKLDEETRHGDPDGPTNARMLVGRLGFGSPDATLFLSLIPDLVHVRGLKRIATLVQLVRSEAQDDRPARGMVLERLLEVLLIEALRATPMVPPSRDSFAGLPTLVWRAPYAASTRTRDETGAWTSWRGRRPFPARSSLIGFAGRWAQRRWSTFCPGGWLWQGTCCGAGRGA